MSIEETLLKAKELIEQVPLDGCGPKDIWHPKYGWVLIDGKPTETTGAFVEALFAAERAAEK